MIDVKNEVRVIEIDHNEPTETLVVRVWSHWNMDSMVNIELPKEAANVTVKASDLIAAIHNSTNTNRQG